MAADARDYVAQLYQQELGRSGADDPGLGYWADAIASGSLSREAVANAIAQSPEALGRDIGTIYQQELGRSREGDAASQYWVDAVASGQMTLDQARNAIARSQEGAAYDVGRVYQSELGRAADDPGSQYWRDALMRGEITEQQFVNAVRQSEEFKALQGGPTPGPKPADGMKELEERLKQQQLEFQQQMEAMRKQQQEQLAAQQRALQQSQQMALMNKATQNAAQGQFPATSPVGAAAPVQGGVAPTFTAAPVTTTPAAVAQPITPTPAQFVPQTYLAPAPPQYRNVNPFQLPFGTPFESYYNIATRRQGMQYPSPFVGLGQPVDGGQMAATQGQPAPAPAQMASPLYGYPFQYYPAQQQGLPAGPTAPAAPTT